MDKACPFCNGIELKMCINPYDHNFVFCELCGTEGPVADSEKQAIYLWLKREYKGD